MKCRVHETLAKSKPPVPCGPLFIQGPLHGAGPSTPHSISTPACPRDLALPVCPPFPQPHQYLDLILLTTSITPILSVSSRPSDQDKGRSRGSHLQSGRQNGQHQYLRLGRRGQPDPARGHYPAHQRVSQLMTPGYPRAVTVKGVGL